LNHKSRMIHPPFVVLVSLWFHLKQTHFGNNPYLSKTKKKTIHVSLILLHWRLWHSNNFESIDWILWLTLFESIMNMKEKWLPFKLESIRDFDLQIFQTMLRDTLMVIPLIDTFEVFLTFLSVWNIVLLLLPFRNSHHQNHINDLFVLYRCLLKVTIFFAIIKDNLRGQCLFSIALFVKWLITRGLDTDLSVS